MSIWLIVGLVGTIVAVIAISVVVYATGVFEYLGGRHPCPSPQPRDKLLARLLAVNCPGLPYNVRPGKSTDLIIEWKIVDADWQGVLSREQIRETYLAFLRLDESRHAARYWEITGRVNWSVSAAGLPEISWNRESLRGRLLSRKSRAVKYGLNSSGSAARVYEYSFDVRTVRDPVVKAIREAGWEFVPVLNRKHAKYEKEAVE